MQFEGSFFEVIQLSAVLLAVGIVWQSLELLSFTKQFAYGQLFSWRYPGYQGLWKGKGRFLSWIMEYPGLPILLGTRLVICLWLISSISMGGLSVTALFLLGILNFLTNYRMVRITDGASVMASIILVGLTLAAWRIENGMIVLVSFFFISLQLALCYFSNGWHKIFTSHWRNGQALVGLFSWRHKVPVLGELMKKYSFLGYIIAWPVLLFELSFPLALFSGELCVLWLGVGLFFHAIIWFFLGLNFFFWTFVSAYPVFIYTALWLAERIY